MSSILVNNISAKTGSIVTFLENARVVGNLEVTGTLNAKVTDFVVNATSTAISSSTLFLGDASGDTITINASTVSIPNNLNFDSNTLFLDASNNRVGIGTNSPNQALEVFGNIRLGNGGGGSQLIYNSTNLYFNNLANGIEACIANGKFGIGRNLTDPDAQLEVLGTGTQLKLSYDGSNASTLAVASDGGLTITSGDGIVAMPGDVTIYDDNNNADTSLSIGTSATERLVIEVLNGSSNKTAEEVHFSTRTASSTVDHGAMIFDIDETDIFRIDDGGTETTGLTHTTTLIATSTTTLQGEVTVNTGIIPDTQDGAYLGSSTKQWSDLFLADGAVISFGDDNEITLTHNADPDVEHDV